MPDCLPIYHKKQIYQLEYSLYVCFFCLYPDNFQAKHNFAKLSQLCTHTQCSCVIQLDLFVTACIPSWIPRHLGWFFNLHTLSSFSVNYIDSSICFDKCIVSCIHHSGTIQKTFIILKLLLCVSCVLTNTLPHQQLESTDGYSIIIASLFLWCFMNRIIQYVAFWP